MPTRVGLANFRSCSRSDCSGLDSSRSQDDGFDGARLQFVQEGDIAQKGVVIISFRRFQDR